MSLDLVCQASHYFNFPQASQLKAIAYAQFLMMCSLLLKMTAIQVMKAQLPSNRRLYSKTSIASQTDSSTATFQSSAFTTASHLLFYTTTTGILDQHSFQGCIQSPTSSSSDDYCASLHAIYCLSHTASRPWSRPLHSHYLSAL